MRISEVRKWGIDLGNVIVKNLSSDARHILQAQLSGVDVAMLREGSEKLAELDLALRSCAELVDDSLEGVLKLVQRVGAEAVWIVSRCSGLERIVNARLLSVFDVYAATGLLRDHVHFVDCRSDKADVCARLGIQGHIDDRGEVLSAFKGVESCLVWFNPTFADVSCWCAQLPKETYTVYGWKELIAQLDA